MESGVSKHIGVIGLVSVALLLGSGTWLLADKKDPFDPENRAGPRTVQPPPKAEVKESPTTRKLAELLSFKVSVQPSQAKPGEVVKVTLVGTVKKGFHTYPITMRTANQLEGQLAKLAYDLDAGLKVLWPVAESKPILHRQGADTALHHEGEFTWSQEFLVLPEATPGEKKIRIKPRLLVCDENRCFGPAPYPSMPTSLQVVAGPAVALSAAMQKRLQADVPAVQIVTAPPSTAADKTPGKGAPGSTTNAPVDPNQNLLGLLGSAFIGAFLMLLTPCVFPMIPITVNFFIKQSEHEHHNPLLMASVYCGTIIALLTLVMLILGRVVIDLANDRWFNLALGSVLILFAFSLFGMFEIELPSFLVNFTAAREGQGGLLGTVFMALTFTITSFTCTGPFLGAMLAPVAGLRPPFLHLALAAVVYSATFAAPFFVLALFPSMLKKMPKSGGWMNAIKVTMGFLELGAALKFLSNADMAWFPGNPRLFNYDTVLCAWIALSFACGLYLIGTFRLPHDDPADHIGVIRMVFAAIFFGLAVYMTPALRNETPAGIVGEGLVAFLPPNFKEKTGHGGSGNGEHLSWHLDYQDAWEEAKRDNKLIFIDFTGVTCTNCRDNEKNVFPRPEVVKEMRQYVRVQLYTDTVPNPALSPGQAKEQADRNSQWRDTLGDLTNPYYVVFRPARDEPFAGDQLKGEVIDRRNGTIRDIADFVRFLQEPLQKQQAQRPPANKPLS